MGLETFALLLGTAVLAGGATMGAKSLMDNNQKKPDQPKQTQNDLGNLTKDEASAGASKKLFRQGLFMTSPTGLQSGSRGRSRLMGA